MSATRRCQERVAAATSVAMEMWLVVQIQRGFPVSVREWTEKPGWG
jgi:hypothetical protein